MVEDGFTFMAFYNHANNFFFGRNLFNDFSVGKLFLGSFHSHMHEILDVEHHVLLVGELARLNHAAGLVLHDKEPSMVVEVLFCHAIERCCQSFAVNWLEGLLRCFPLLS